ncbi:MAG: PEPxxWA-CTERM sorting domain-containing protein [Alphaproteobacteria bacterium]|nr:PEPxxWA-CTERM sorting domain-containing protein [Alphaproteobacteria bacterium]
MRVTTKGITSTTGFHRATAGISLLPDSLHPFDFYLPIAFSFYSESCTGSAHNCVFGIKGAGGWDVTDHVFHMLPNRDYTLSMSAAVQQRQPDHNSISVGGPGTLRSGTAYAYVDPVIKIAPGVSGFTISTNGPSMLVGGVPEPASWAMLLAGFAVTGAVARRRRALPRAAG